jgi:TRAP-type C4-dicarboxylate transport system permease small subunit
MSTGGLSTGGPRRHEGRAESGDGHSRILQIGAAALLALVTLAAAWAGYSAARRGTASGIGSSFKLPGVRYALIVIGSVLLLVSIVLILQQPGLPS